MKGIIKSGHNRSDYRTWTTEDVVLISKMWKTKTIDEISQKLNCDKLQLHPFISTLRRNGFDLPSKSRNGSITRIIKEAKIKLKLK